MKWALISVLLSTLCLLLRCTINAEAQQLEKKKITPDNDVRDRSSDKNNDAGGIVPHSEMKPFEKPGTIVPGLKVQNILELLAKAYNADTVRGSLEEGCRILGPLLKEYFSDDIYGMTCGPILESEQTGTYLETAEICVELWAMASEDQQHHEDPYSNQRMGNPGFDGEHEDGMHFNYYDQHQETNADFTGGSMDLKYWNTSQLDYSENTGRLIAPDDAIMFYTSMILSPLFENGFPQEIIRNLLQDTFKVDPNDPTEVCSVTEAAMFDDSQTAKDWLDYGIGRVLEFLIRLTPWICSETDNYDTPPTTSDYEQFGQPPPSISFKQVVRGFLSYLGNFESPEEFCMTSVASAEHFNSNTDELGDIVSTIKTKVLSTVQDHDSCIGAVNFFNSLMAEYSLGEIFVYMLGFESEEQTCTFVIDAFNPATAANRQIDISGFNPQISQDYQDYLERQPPPIRELIQTFGKTYNAGTLQEGLAIFCDTFNQTGQIYSILGPGGSDLCVKGHTIRQFYESCITHLNGFSNHYKEGEGDEHYVADHGANNHQLDEGTMLLYDHKNPLHGIMKVLANRYGLFDIMNPYSVCDAGVDIIQTSSDDLKTLQIETAAMTLSKLLKTEYPLALCTMNSDPKPGIKDNDGIFISKGSEPPESVEQFVEELLQIAAIVAEVEDQTRFCELIMTESGSESNHQEFLNTLALKMVNNLFSVKSDLKTCTRIAEIVRGISPEIFFYISGKQSGKALCTVVVNAFNRRNSDKFQPPSFPNDLSFLGSQEPFQNPGQIFSFLSVDDMIRLAGKLYNQDTLMESIRVLCKSYSKSLSQIPEIGKVIVQVCSSIEENAVDELAWNCYTYLVPTMFGPQHPIALRTINVPYEMMKVLLPMVDHPVSLETENVCSAEEEFVNSDLSMRDIVDQLLDAFVPILVKYGDGICNDMDGVYDYLKPKREKNCYQDYVGKDIAWDGTPCEDYIVHELDRFNQLYEGVFKFASNAAGFRNKKALCAAVTNAEDSTDWNSMEVFVDILKDRIYSFMSNSKQCQYLVSKGQNLFKLFIPPDQVQRQFYQFTGYRTPAALCVETVRLFNRRKKEVCRGIVDCAGVCNGNAVRDCRGECMGPAVYDCARECNGAAYENHCNFCVGGRTRRSADFGTDKCGVCRTGKKYRITWDCHGTCNGTAFYDKCSECVGGTSGRSENFNADRIDCRGICDGRWIEDGCGYCNPPSQKEIEDDPTTSSKYMDCHGTCHRPGTRKQRKARLNNCGICIGGETGLESNEGINACGQCLNSSDADETSCAGCDGVPNSQKEIDACGVCGGDGGDCVGVSAVFPKAILEEVATKLSVFGAGFEEDTKLACVFVDGSGINTYFKVIETIDSQHLVCEPNLSAGDYEVKIEKDGFLSQDVSAMFTVFEDIPIVEITPTDLTLADDTFELFLTADVAFTALTEITTPFIIAEGVGIRHKGERYVTPGKFATDVDNELQFVGSVPDHSLRVNMWGSLDGINKLSSGTSGSNQGFPLTFWAEEPMLTSIRLNSNGASLDARFDLRVAYESLKMCEDIFEDTSKLGQNAECIWKGPTRLKIVIGKGNDLIVVGDELTLREDAVRTFKQDYSYAASGSIAVEGPRRHVRVTARLRGTNRITSCGNVRLTGRKSKGGAGRDMTYSWSVSSDGNVNEIAALLSDFRQADFTMDGTLMDADTIYTFEMSATNFLGSTDYDTIEVRRSAIATPEVSIIPNGVDVTSVLVSERFSLTAEVTFYSDCVPPGKTVFMWSVDNEQVPLNLQTINQRRLFVGANTLPGDQNITFTVRIYKESDPETYVNQSVMVTTHYSDLIAVIEGGNELTIGRGVGNVTLDGSTSFDPDDLALDMTYEWLCEQITDETACWSYKEDEEGQLFPNAEDTTKSVLNFDPLAMEPDKMFKFTQVVSKGSRSAYSSVNVYAMNGDPPRVMIRAIEGKVRSDKVFSLKARIHHSSQLSGFIWATVDTELVSGEDEEDEGFAYLDLNDEDNLISPSSLLEVDEKQSISFLSIKPGVLTPGSAYMFQINVSTVDGQYGLAKIDVHILAEVTSCSIGLVDGNNAYTELEQVDLLVDNCAADDTAYPLTYQMFIVKNDAGDLEAFTERQSEPIIAGVGKPPRGASDTNTFVAKVCDSYRSCRKFSSNFTVTTKDTFTVEEAHELKATLVEEEKFKQNYLTALVNYNTISQKVDISFNSTQSERRRRRGAALETSAQAREQLELMELVLESTVMDTATAELQIGQLHAFTISDLTLEDQSRLLDIVIQLVYIFKQSEEDTISQSGIDEVLLVTAEISQDLDPQFNANILKKIKSIESAVSVSLMSQLVVGGDAIETVSEFVVSSILRAIPSGIFQSKSSGVAASINFGREIAARFGADWACSSGSCSGVAIHYDHYETGVDYFSSDVDDQNRRAADIISIEVLDPDSGEEIIIEGLTDPITMNLTISIPKDNSFYECTFWNATSSEWSTEGLTTVEHLDNLVECFTTHLSQFTVMAQSLPTTESTLESSTALDSKKKGRANTGAIIGGIVGSVVAFSLLSLAAVYTMKHFSWPPQRRRQQEDQEMQDTPQTMTVSTDIN